MSGNVELTNSTKTIQKATINSVIFPGTSVIVKSNSELILRDAKNRFCILRKSGSFSYADLQQYMQSQQKVGLLKSVAHFITNQFLNKTKNIRSYAEEHLKQTGGVSRNGCTYPLMLQPGMGSMLSEGNLKFEWAIDSSAAEYELLVFNGMDEAGEPLMRYRTTCSTSPKEVNTSLFSKESVDSIFSWVVYPKGVPNCARYTFQVVPAIVEKSEAETIAANTSHIKSKTDQLLKRAALYEQKGLLKKAEETYLELSHLRKKKIHKELYELFLARNGMLNI